MCKVCIYLSFLYSYFLSTEGFILSVRLFILHGVTELQLLAGTLQVAPAPVPCAPLPAHSRLLPGPIAKPANMSSNELILCIKTYTRSRALSQSSVQFLLSSISFSTFCSTSVLLTPADPNKTKCMERNLFLLFQGNLICINDMIAFESQTFHTLPCLDVFTDTLMLSGSLLIS